MDGRLRRRRARLRWSADDTSANRDHTTLIGLLLLLLTLILVLLAIGQLVRL